MMSLLPFWALNVVVALLSMEGSEAIEFHQKYLNLCSEDERWFYGFWIIINDNFIFGVNYPFKFNVSHSDPVLFHITNSVLDLQKDFNLLKLSVNQTVGHVDTDPDQGVLSRKQSWRPVSSERKTSEHMPKVDEVFQSMLPYTT